MADARKVAGMFLEAMEHQTENALDSYLKKHPKADRANHSVKKLAPKSKKSEPASATKVTTELTGIFKPSDQTISTILEAAKPDFDKIDSAADQAAESFKSTKVEVDYGDDLPDNYDPTDYMAITYPKLSLAEKRIHVAGHKVGEKFEKSLTSGERKMHDRYLHNWHSSSTSFDREGFDKPEDFDHTSQELQGMLSAMEVGGHAAPEDEALDKTSNGGLGKARTKAANDHRLIGYAKKMYDYQQAYFRNAGLKEITLYRGVKAPEVDGAPKGGGVKVQSRELSSFTADPNIAKRFGRIIEFKVPVERVFASSLVRPLIGSEAGEHTSNEAEFLIMGASDLEGRTMGKPVNRKTASDVIEVEISDENADWLSHTRELTKPTAAQKVATRFVVAQALNLIPEYKAAHKALTQGDRKLAIDFSRRLMDLILPNGERPQWHTGLNIRQKNAIYQLYREADQVYSHLSGVSLMPGGDDLLNRTALRTMEDWPRALRALEVGGALADQASEIQHGPFTVVPVPGLSKNQIAAALAALDDAASKIRLKFPQVLYGKVFLAKTLRKRTAAHYIPNLDAIALTVATKFKFSDVYAIIHELGHRHDAKFLSEQGRREYWNLSQRRESPLHVTPYGATKPVENYAEGFAYFVLGKDMPAELAAILADESM